VERTLQVFNSHAVPGMLEHSEAELRAAFLEQIDKVPGGERLQRCIQCGTCTGSCPVSYTMDVSPRQIIALFRAGAVEDILRSRTIWVCASCYNCTVRCPAQIKITDLLYALKRIAIERGIFPAKFPVYALSESFARQVKRYGRNYEMGLIRSFYLRTHPTRLLGMIGLGLNLMRTGRLKFFPEKIRGRHELRAILERAEQIERPQEPTHETVPTDAVGYDAIA